MTQIIEAHSSAGKTFNRGVLWSSCIPEKRAARNYFIQTLIAPDQKALAGEEGLYFRRSAGTANRFNPSFQFLFFFCPVL